MKFIDLFSGRNAQRKRREDIASRLNTWRRKEKTNEQSSKEKQTLGTKRSCICCPPMLSKLPERPVKKKNTKKRASLKRERARDIYV